ncbi:MAG TPA: acetyl-CoA C-acetyltransferase [Candidatus Cryosericum sp.]|nr:acetyl-CoA C-acetyltransferase [Candidatus Cryosericum sp.]
MEEVLISSPLRSAIGKFGGSLKALPAPKVEGFVIKSILETTGVDPGKFDDVIIGNVIVAGEKMNPARQAAIYGGVPETVPAMTVNRVCGSGLQAVVSGIMEIQSGYARMVLAGGMENMDQAPYLLTGARYGYRMGEGKVYDALLTDGLNDAFTDKHSGLITDEYLVPKYGVTRLEQDEFSVESHRKAAAAIDEGRFKSQIVPIPVGKDVIFDTDESVRRDSTVEKLGALKPAFKADGTITAGNAPGVNSGASAMILSTPALAEQFHLDVFGKVRGYAVAAVDPNMFGIAPVYAIRAALERAGVSLGDIDLFEVNEAFAAIAIVVQKELGIPSEKLNVNGGAVALGHPIGASGAMILTKLLHELRRTGGKLGVASLCIGGGQGIALVVENTH